MRYTNEELAQGLKAISRHGGVDDQMDAEGQVWGAPNPIGALRAAIVVMDHLAAQRESREAMAALHEYGLAFAEAREAVKARVRAREFFAGESR